MQNQNQSAIFRKLDFLVALVIGEAIAWLVLAIIKNIKLELPYLWGVPILFPILSAAGLYICYVIGKKIAVIFQIGKYLLVGFLNTFLDWGVLSLLVFLFRRFLGINSKDVLVTALSVSVVYYTLFKTLSFIISISNSYVWNKLWTFKKSTTAKTGRELLQFFVVSIIGLLMNVIIASVIFKLVTPLPGVSSDQWGVLAAVMATIASMVWNFIGYKFIVFKE